MKSGFRGHLLSRETSLSKFHRESENRRGQECGAEHVCVWLQENEGCGAKRGPQGGHGWRDPTAHPLPERGPQNHGQQSSKGGRPPGHSRDTGAAGWAHHLPVPRPRGPQSGPQTPAEAPTIIDSSAHGSPFSESSPKMLPQQHAQHKCTPDTRTPGATLPTLYMPVLALGLNYRSGAHPAGVPYGWMRTQVETSGH